MSRKWIAFLAVGVALILGVAPSAMAGHCLRCRPTPDGIGTCVTAFGVIPGREFCEDDGVPYCQLSGEVCVPHGFAPDPEPFAADYLVASVERLDEPRNAVDETLVASIETAQPSKR